MTIAGFPLGGIPRAAKVKLPVRSHRQQNDLAGTSSAEVFLGSYVWTSVSKFSLFILLDVEFSVHLETHGFRRFLLRRREGGWIGDRAEFSAELRLNEMDSGGEQKPDPSEKPEKSGLNGYVFRGALAQAAWLPLALLTSSAKALASLTARSASIFRSISIPAVFRPCMKRL